MELCDSMPIRLTVKSHGMGRVPSPVNFYCRRPVPEEQDDETSPLVMKTTMDFCLSAETVCDIVELVLSCDFGLIIVDSFTLDEAFGVRYETTPGSEKGEAYVVSGDSPVELTPLIVRNTAIGVEFHTLEGKDTLKEDSPAIKELSHRTIYTTYNTAPDPTLLCIISHHDFPAFAYYVFTNTNLTPEGDRRSEVTELCKKKEFSEVEDDEFIHILSAKDTCDRLSTLSSIGGWQSVSIEDGQERVLNPSDMRLGNREWVEKSLP